MLSDINQLRLQFPVLHQQVNGKPLVYLDNAATTQKPLSVINALHTYYTTDNANIHRGAHALAHRATGMYEETRKAVQQFIHAAEEQEIIFTKGVTESINLLAQTWGKAFLREGDEVIITWLEHHSNIVPWQMICAERKAHLKVVPIHGNGELNMAAYENMLTERTKMVACTWASNALGTVNPVKEIIEKAHRVGALVMLDGAQAGSHLPIDVQALNVDFLTLSSHKLYGPTGVGVLYGKRKWLEIMPPYQGGGEMIKEVSFERTTYNEIPYKFEAGTPNIADVIAFRHALEFVSKLGKQNIMKHENALLSQFTEGLATLDANRNLIQLFGTASHKVAVQSFLLKGQHPFDTGMMLDARGIAVRTGHHCTQPLMRYFNIEGTVRASFAVYNTSDEVNTLLNALESLVKRLSA